jgi:HAMP domain-containing protein
MFANLSKGNILYGLDRRDKIKVFTASVEKVTPVYRNQNNMFGQVPELRLDILTTINGETREFKQVPSNTAIADFGDKTFIIADNKESLYNGIKELLKASENIVESAPYHETLIPQYKEALNEVMPGTVSNADEVKALRSEVGTLKNQLAEAIALLKGQTKKQNI